MKRGQSGQNLVERILRVKVADCIRPTVGGSADAKWRRADEIRHLWGCSLVAG